MKMDAWRAILWRQFGAAIDMLGNAIDACPDEHWGACWYTAFHAIFYLDYYSTRSDKEFAPPAPFGLTELEPDLMPDRVYSKADLRTYLDYCRTKCHAAIEALTEQSLTTPCRFARRDATVAELFLYNMRHVQHHAGQLNLIVRQHSGEAPRWVSANITLPT
jgi:DinB superfamily